SYLVGLRDRDGHVGVAVASVGPNDHAVRPQRALTSQNGLPSGVDDGDVVVAGSVVQIRRVDAFDGHAGDPDASNRVTPPKLDSPDSPTRPTRRISRIRPRQQARSPALRPPLPQARQRPGSRRLLRPPRALVPSASVPRRRRQTPEPSTRSHRAPPPARTSTA